MRGKRSREAMLRMAERAKRGMDEDEDDELEEGVGEEEGQEQEEEHGSEDEDDADREAVTVARGRKKQGQQQKKKQRTRKEQQEEEAQKGGEEQGEEEGDDEDAGKMTRTQKTGRKPQKKQKKQKKTKRSGNVPAHHMATESTALFSAHELLNREGFTSDGRYRNKQRVLVLSSRGITARDRHLLQDLRRMLPHHKKDVKLDGSKGDMQVVNDLAQMKNCNTCLYLENRKRKDLYMWLAQTPNGPSAKFLVVNVHTMDELRLTGNCMIGSRPLLSFDTAFSVRPHLQFCRALLTEIFGTPRGHPKSKPFFDHVVSFSVADDHIWVRHYQIVDKAAQKHRRREEQRQDEVAGGSGAAAAAAAASAGNLEADTELVEIGPRFVLLPIRFFAGAFGGPTVYRNPRFISPNVLRSNSMRGGKGERYRNRAEQQARREARMQEFGPLPQDEADAAFARSLRSAPGSLEVGVAAAVAAQEASSSKAARNGARRAGKGATASAAAAAAAAAST